MRGNVLRFILVGVFGLLADALSLLISKILMEITDVIAGDGGTEALRVTAFETLFVLSGILILGIMYGVLFADFKRTAMNNYKQKVMALITGKDIFAFKGESSATYISALTNDATSIESGYLSGIIDLVSQSFLFSGSLVLMLMASPLLTLITIGLLIVPIIISVLTGQTLVKYEKQVSDRNSSFVASISEILRGFSVVKCFKAEDKVTSLVNDSSKKLENVKYKKNALTAIIGVIGNVAGGGTQFGLFLIGALIALKSGNITAGTLLMFVNLMNNLLSPISTMPSTIAGIRASKALVTKMANALSETGDEGTMQINPSVPCDMALHDVSFAYEEGKTVLHGISTSFEEGHSYALVGGSGSGKSTILKLLMSSYDNYEGSITVSGEEIRDITTGSLYDNLSLIEQDVFVFNSTIRDNITMFKDFPDDKVDAAIERAGLAALIRDKGEDYTCGEGGSNLSGGERQRISIARSLLLENKILLVDEATAALDAETAFHVTNSILDLDGKTKIVVTHDLDEATLSRFDRILALKEGRLVETGSFSELMARKGYFYSLFTIAQ